MLIRDGAGSQYAIFQNLFDIVVFYNAFSLCLLNMKIVC